MEVLAILGWQALPDQARPGQQVLVIQAQLRGKKVRMESEASTLER
jgi:hypothetical protein